MIIYCATNTLNSKIYIGQTRNSLNTRRSAHISKAVTTNVNNLFLNALRKYGFKNFYWEEIEICNDIKTLNELERYYIRLSNSLYPNGYNSALGGNEKTRTTIWKNNISKSLTGRKLSKEHIEKIKNLRLNKPAWNRTDYIGIERYGWVVFKQEYIKTKKSVFVHIKYKDTIIKKVVRVDSFLNKKRSDKIVKNSNGEIFESVKSASEKYNVSPSAIRNSIKGYYRSTPWKCSNLSWYYY